MTRVGRGGTEQFPHAIYVLSDPRTPDDWRYVGWTIMLLPVRLQAHIDSARKTPRTYRARWINSLLNHDIKPIITAVEYTSDYAEAERRWIADLRAAGYRLTNGTDGGKGVLGARWHLTPEQVEALRNRPRRPAKRTEPRAANMCRNGHFLSPETTRIDGDGSRVCLACEKERKERSNERRRTQRAMRPAQEKTRCKNGHDLRPETTRFDDRGYRHCLACESNLRERKIAQGRAWRAAHRTPRKKRGSVSEETRRKLSNSGKGRKHSEETKCKMAESHRGQTRTPEHCARISEGKRQGWKRRKERARE